MYGIDKYCEHCEYFKYTVDYSSKWGLCRRFPPIVIYDSMTSRESSVVPETKKHSVCGEYITKAEPLLKKQIQHTLTLSVRARTALEKANIITLGDLQKNLPTLCNIKNLGEKSINEIYTRFKRYMKSYGAVGAFGSL